MAVAVLDGSKLRRELRRRGLTQREFGRAVHLRQSTISFAVSGKPVKAETIYRICLGLELIGAKA